MHSFASPTQFAGVQFLAEGMQWPLEDEVVFALTERRGVRTQAGPSSASPTLDDGPVLFLLGRATNIARKIAQSKSKLISERRGQSGPNITPNELGRELLFVLHPNLLFLHQQHEYYTYSPWFNLLTEQIIERDLLHAQELLHSGTTTQKLWMVDVFNAAAEGIRSNSRSAAFQRQMKSFQLSQRKESKTTLGLFTKVENELINPGLLPLLLTLGEPCPGVNQTNLQIATDRLHDLLSNLNSTFSAHLAGIIWKQERHLDGSYQIQLLLVLKSNHLEAEATLFSAIEHQWKTKALSTSAFVFNMKTPFPLFMYRGYTIVFPPYCSMREQLRRFKVYLHDTDTYMCYKPRGHSAISGTISFL